MTARPVPELAAAAEEALSVLRETGTPACLIGGMVVNRWGEPMATSDVDFTVLAPYGEEAHVLDVLLRRCAS